jgi:methylenetetrahydrofolate dehydrogenase (NADP+)/methenyltetrahydrofolate cyclohydrolase
MAKVLDGRKVSQQLQIEIKKEVAAFKTAWNTTPTLALVRAGNDPASVSYAGMIERTCKKTDVGFEAHTLSAEASEEEVVRLIRKLNDDQDVHGIILQQPLPEGIRPKR